MVNSANIQRTCEKTKQRRRFIAVTHKYNRLNAPIAEGIKPKMTQKRMPKGCQEILSPLSRSVVQRLRHTERVSAFKRHIYNKSSNGDPFEDLYKEGNALLPLVVTIAKVAVINLSAC